MEDRHRETIFALSSGGLPAGIAVIRMSGPGCRFALETITGSLPEPRYAALRTFRDPEGAAIDTGLALWFPGPASFTGEDIAEFHLHGSPAIAAAMLKMLATFAGFRMAEPGEFSRRAFDHGRMDLTQVEGLADLLAARTEAQRRQALRQSQGELARQLEAWRTAILRMRALVEADFDFADEDDVPDTVAASVWREADSVSKQIGRFLEDRHAGEIIREGFEVVLLGPPNSGKSSLLNALARRDVAIVADEAGTTRDLIEVAIDLDGYAVTLVDTAGLRDDAGAVEREGMARARARARQADLALWLRAPETFHVNPDPELEVEVFHSKDDARTHGGRGISVRRSDGLDDLLDFLLDKIRERMPTHESLVITRQRHRDALETCRQELALAAASDGLAAELRAEHFRRAGDAIGRITGRIDVEDLLDVIFREFCIGK